jgi:hypothetical protein
MLDHTNNKSQKPDSLSLGKIWSEALDRDFPANQQNTPCENNIAVKDSYAPNLIK